MQASTDICVGIIERHKFQLFYVFFFSIQICAHVKILYKRSSWHVHGNRMQITNRIDGCISTFFVYRRNRKFCIEKYIQIDLLCVSICAKFNSTRNQKLLNTKLNLRRNWFAHSIASFQNIDFLQWKNWLTCSRCSAIAGRFCICQINDQTNVQYQNYESEHFIFFSHAKLAICHCSAYYVFYRYLEKIAHPHHPISKYNAKKKNSK